MPYSFQSSDQNSSTFASTASDAGMSQPPSASRLEQAGLRDDADVGGVAALGEHGDLRLELARALVLDRDAGAGLEVGPRLVESIGLEVEDRAGDRDLGAVERAVRPRSRPAVDVGRGLLGDVARTGRECEADRGGRHDGGHPTAMPSECHVISSLSVVQGKPGTGSSLHGRTTGRFLTRERRSRFGYRSAFRRESSGERSHRRRSRPCGTVGPHSGNGSTFAPLRTTLASEQPDGGRR